MGGYVTPERLLAALHRAEDLLHEYYHDEESAAVDQVIAMLKQGHTLRDLWVMTHTTMTINKILAEFDEWIKTT